MKSVETINENDFLELDDNLLKEDSEIFYKYESILNIYYYCSNNFAFKG